MLPAFWIAVKMHHGQDEYAVRLQSINDTEWETVKHVLSSIANNDAKGSRRDLNPRECGFQFVKKFSTKTGLLLVVPFGGSNDLRIGIRMKSHPGH